ncbi:MAG: T9SS type A sorting domain-containing protein [Ekhidna sp.]|uniref:T9SS type A sorting domain-containing protein n=1 Tax=Ekhidna sp. TaxID=2608089 RepID=UPI0032EB3BCF
MKCLIILCFINAPFFLWSQGRVFLGSGTPWVNQGNPNIVLNNTSFVAFGNWQSASETLTITGNAATASTTINKFFGALTIYDLEINKSINGITMASGLTINNSINLQSGQLNLNGHNLLLNNASILNENSTNYISGNTGTVTITQTLNAPSQVNPGNIGVAITSTANLGSTTITRSHAPAVNGSYDGINRLITIAPTNNTALNASLRMYYLDSELNGKVENNLSIWEDNGVDWIELGSTNSDVTNNWIEINGLSQLSTFTLSDISNPLPVELIYFRGEAYTDGMLLQWATASEVNNDKFVLFRSKDGLNFKSIAEIKGNGNSSLMTNYSYRDKSISPGSYYYRLIQMDFDGKSRSYEIIYLENDFMSDLIIAPNPVNDYIRIIGLSEIVSVVLLDQYGRKIQEYYQPEEIIPLVGLPSGTYFIQITSQQKVYHDKITIN